MPTLQRRWTSFEPRLNANTGSGCTVPLWAAYCTGWGSRIKKDLRSSEQKRPDVARDRTIWITRRQPFMRNHLERLIIIDETSLKSNMTKTCGWTQIGDRLIEHTPAGRWNIETFIAGLRHDRIKATGVMNGATSDHIETNSRESPWWCRTA